MRRHLTTTLLLAAGFGAITGMRSLSGCALLSRRLSARPKRSAGPAERLLASGAATRGLQLLAGGELIADKLPFVGNRIEPGPLAARALLGGLAGAALAERSAVVWAGPALAGAAAAVAAAFAAYHLRRAAAQRLDLPDRLVAVLEDGVVMGAGTWLAARVE